jgi:hypothetical protein
VDSCPPEDAPAWKEGEADDSSFKRLEFPDLLEEAAHGDESRQGDGPDDSESVLPNLLVHLLDRADHWRSTSGADL